jgi:hypothetical protein
MDVHKILIFRLLKSNHEINKFTKKWYKVRSSKLKLPIHIRK